MSYYSSSPIGPFQSPPTPSSLVSCVASILPNPLPRRTPTATLIAARNYLLASQRAGFLVFDNFSDGDFRSRLFEKATRISKRGERRQASSRNGGKARTLPSSPVLKPDNTPTRRESVTPTKIKCPPRFSAVREYLDRTKTPEKSLVSLYNELDMESRHILRGKFLPKGALAPLDSTTAARQKQIDDLLSKKRICLTGCRYEVFTEVAASCGFELVGDNDLWNLHWSDIPLSQDKIMQMRRIQDMYSVFCGLLAPFQKCNHFPGMYEICRKDRLGRNLNRLKRLYPGDYNFFPETFDLPTEQSELTAYARRRRKNNLTFIIKPESGCQGRGIFLLRNWKKLSPFAKCVCQVYVPHPFLIDGYKFDQRIYVLITCVDPLRLYIYEEGIARFATVKYEVPNDENLEVVYMHLTNYSLNKFSESYVREGEGSKRTLSSIYTWMEQNGYDVPKLVRAIDEIVVKTLLCAGPTLKHNYKTSFPKKNRGCSCFELLGFDILIDRHLNPILLEVNHSPSFHVDLPVDHQVKKALIKDMLNMVYLGDALAKSQQNPGAAALSEKISPVAKRGRGSKSSPTPRTPPPLVEEVPIENQNVVSEALQTQFKHEMRNRGRFRLVYTSDKPGRFSKLCAKENYCGYSVAPVPIAPLQQIPYDKDPDNLNQHQELWRPLKTMSTVKETKRGHKYVETRVIVQRDMVGTSTRDVQKFRVIPEYNHKRENPPQPPPQELFESEGIRSKESNKGPSEVDERLQLLQEKGREKKRRKSRKGRRERGEVTEKRAPDSGDYEMNSQDDRDNNNYVDVNNNPGRRDLDQFNKERRRR